LPSHFSFFAGKGGVGKSTVTACIALLEAICCAPALVLVICPAARQSKEFLRNVSRFRKKLGMKITQGQLLGRVGSTGDASPEAPHLHYEIKAMQPGESWWQGAEIDPYPILAGRPATG